MAKSEIEISLKSKYDGEGFKKADQNIRAFSKSAKTATDSVSKVTNALGTMEGKAGKIAGSIGNIFSSFAQGGIIGLAISGITTAFSLIADKIKETEEKAKVAAENLRNSFTHAMQKVTESRAFRDFMNALNFNEQRIGLQTENDSSNIDRDIAIQKKRQQGIIRRENMSDEEKAVDIAKENAEVNALTHKKEISDANIKYLAIHSEVEQKDTEIKDIEKDIEEDSENYYAYVLKTLKPYTDKIRKLNDEIDMLKQQTPMDATQLMSNGIRMQSLISERDKTIRQITDIDAIINGKRQKNHPDNPEIDIPKEYEKYNEDFKKYDKGQEEKKKLLTSKISERQNLKKKESNALKNVGLVNEKSQTGSMQDKKAIEQAEKKLADKRKEEGKKLEELYQKQYDEEVKRIQELEKQRDIEEKKAKAAEDTKKEQENHAKKIKELDKKIEDAKKKLAEAEKRKTDAEDYIGKGGSLSGYLKKNRDEQRDKDKKKNRIDNQEKLNEKAIRQHEFNVYGPNVHMDEGDTIDDEGTLVKKDGTRIKARKSANKSEIDELRRRQDARNTLSGEDVKSVEQSILDLMKTKETADAQMRTNIANIAKALANGGVEI